MGIGTTSPQALLHLHNTSMPELILSRYTSNIQGGNLNHGELVWKSLNRGVDSAIIRSTSQAVDGLLGFDDAGRLEFLTSSGPGASLRMVISESGNVGIGTTSPNNTLDVSGTGRITTSLTTGALYSTNITSTNVVGTNISAGTLSLSNVNVSTATIGSLYNSSHTIVGTLGSYVTSPKIWMYGRGDTTNPLYVIQPYDSGNIGMGLGAYFNASGTPTMSTTSTGWLIGKNPFGFGVIKCSGSVGSTATVSYPFTIYNDNNVGIGHNIPKSTLHLSPSNNNTTGNILFEAGFTSDGGNAGWTAMNFNGYNNAGEQRINTNKNRWRLVVDQRSTDDTMFIDTFNGSTGTTLMTFKTSGNVGIGTTAPGSALHVTGTIGALPIGTGIHMGTDFVNNASIIQINQGGSTSGFSIIDFGYSNTNYVSRIIHDNTDKRLEFVVNAGTTAMTLSSSGNVGIGTTTPVYTLDITGTCDVSTSITTAALYSTNLTSTNIVGTNISSGTLTLSTGLTSASAQITNANVTTSTIGTARITTSLLATGNSNTIGNIFTTGGNVGIGKSSPSTTLDVNGTIRSSYEMIVGTSGSLVNYPKLNMFFTSNLTHPIISMGAFDSLNPVVAFGAYLNTEGSTIMSSSTTAYSIGRTADTFIIRGYNGTLGSLANTTTAGVLRIKSGNFSINTDIEPFTTLSMNGGTVGNGVVQIVSLPSTVNGGRSQDGISLKAWNDGNHILQFYNTAGVLRGTIGGNGASAVTYNTSSDIRLKENITNLNNGIDIIKQLRPVEFTWRSDNRRDFGFIAQEFYQVIPGLRQNFSSYSHCDCNTTDMSNGVLCNCENYDHDEPVDKEGNPLYYGLDYSKITPYLTKALQETIAELEKLRQDFEEYKNTHP